jgi:5,5'-dehydrodivanillate O-demethylase
VRVQALGEYFTLYREQRSDADCAGPSAGRVFMVEDRCPHRQTSLYIGWVEEDRIRCFYHGWAFDGRGQCVEMPAESASYAAKVKIRAYPVQEYLGLVFAYLGDGEPPPLPRFPELEDASGGGVRVVNRYVVPCNWFQRYENDLDEVHVHFVHAVSTKKVGLTEIPDVQVTETDYGIFRQGVRKSGGPNHDLKGYHMMPNISMVDLVPSPEFAYRTFQVAWRVPIDDVSMMTCSVGMRRIDPARAHEAGRMKPAVKPDPDPDTLCRDILAGKLRIQDVDPTYPALFILQDNVVLAAQGAMTDRSKDRLGVSDKGVQLLRRIYQRELALLAEGKPVKAWRRPEQPFTDLVFVKDAAPA